MTVLRRRTILVLAVAGVGGVLLLITADRFDAPALIGPGLLLFAVGVFATGVDAIVRRHTVERIRETHRTTIFEGGAAVLLGIALIVFAIGLAVAGAGFLFGAEARLLAAVQERPGGVLLSLGCVTAAGGGSRVLGARSWRGSAGRFLAYLPNRIGGLALVIVGIGLLLIGVLEVVDPAGFDRLAAPVLAPFAD